MMLAARNVALRVNGLRVSEARISHGKKVSKLIITDPLLGELTVDDNSRWNSWNFCIRQRYG
jgi:hypothetical protein